jgi:hypothetical protein
MLLSMRQIDHIEFAQERMEGARLTLRALREGVAPVPGES